MCHTITHFSTHLVSCIKFSYFRLKAKNGQIILSSQGYAGKAGANNGIESVRKNSQVAERYDTKVAKNGKHLFNIVARNGQVVATSNKWDEARTCKTRITSVKKGAVKAKVEVV